MIFALNFSFQFPKRQFEEAVVFIQIVVTCVKLARVVFKYLLWVLRKTCCVFITIENQSVEKIQF